MQNSWIIYIAVAIMLLGGCNLRADLENWDDIGVNLEVGDEDDDLKRERVRWHVKVFRPDGTIARIRNIVLPEDWDVKVERVD